MWFKWRIILLYAVVSLILLQNVYETSKTVIDEQFHVQQGINYCHGFYREWDPKITTLPGLYLLTTFIPRCSLYYLRLIPLVCSIINFYLILKIKSNVTNAAASAEKGELNVLIDSMSLALLPPMYFFSFIYYTDIPSITTILLTLYFSMVSKHTIASLCGLLSVLMRQTNVVWVAGVLGSKALETMIARAYPKMDVNKTTLSHLFGAATRHLRQPTMFLELVVDVLRQFYGYILVVLSFIAFLVINGSIVVGDKHAHEATIHVPQLFYFSLFTLVFGTSLWLPNLKRFFVHLRSVKSIALMLIAALIMLIIVHYNTVVHPYLLADNRHYTFYVWTRLYNRYSYFRYLMIPVYVFGMYQIHASLRGSIAFKMFFYIGIFLTICLQALIEVRYFLIPFLILRLCGESRKRWSAVELLCNLLINYLTLNIFFSVETRWPDFEEPQRIIW